VRSGHSQSYEYSDPRARCPELRSRTLLTGTREAEIRAEIRPACAKIRIARVIHTPVVAVFGTRPFSQTNHRRATIACCAGLTWPRLVIARNGTCIIWNFIIILISRALHGLANPLAWRSVLNTTTFCLMHIAACWRDNVAGNLSERFTETG
jgi:hypothetical protein